MWKLMATAPKDGTELLVWGEYEGRPPAVLKVRWGHELLSGLTGWRICDQVYRDTGELTDELEAAHYWRPLPNPPEEP